MITLNGRELRNLEEQVLKNKEDIAKHYQATQLPANLAGIKVVGKINSYSDLRGITGDEYGEAYVQVSGNDTYLWVWTRANPDAGEPADYWLDIPFTTVGPQGPKGDRGEEGEDGVRGSKWFIKTEPPQTTEGYIEGDMVLVPSTGQIFHLHNQWGHLLWLNEGTLQGAQGPQGKQGLQGPIGPTGRQGPKGPQGDPAQNVIIKGVVTSVDQIPDPYSVSRDSAFLLETYENGDYDNPKYNMFIITGDAILAWYDAGRFNEVGSIITVNNEIVTQFDADTKLDACEGTWDSKYTDTFIPIGVVSANGAIITAWRRCIREADGLIPVGSVWKQSEFVGTPALRGTGGDIPLPTQTTTTKYYMAARRDWVSQNFQKVMFESRMEGTLSFGKPVLMYKGYVGYPNGVAGAEEISEILRPNGVDLHLNNAKFTQYFYTTINDFNDYVRNEGQKLCNLTVAYHDPASNRTIECPVINYGYDDQMLGEEYFFMTYLDTALNVPYTMFYYYYSYNLEEDGTSFQEIAQSQNYTNYLMYIA